MRTDRRKFISDAASLGAMGMMASALPPLASHARAAEPNDYKAIVCVFLQGGNDNHNTMAPWDAAGHSAYISARPTIGLSRSELSATVLEPLNDLGGRGFALHPALGPLATMFHEGDLAIVQNTGTLVAPTSKDQFLRETVKVPPKLFSHNDQQNFVQSSYPEGAQAGWGGKIAESFASWNYNPALTSISSTSGLVFGEGVAQRALAVGTAGPPLLFYGSETLFNSPSFVPNLHALMQGSPFPIGAAYADVFARSVSLGRGLKRELDRVPEAEFPGFNPADQLAAQLKLLARMIAVAPSLGMRRQVFIASLGGFDTHDSLRSRHPVILRQLANALAAFHSNLKRLGMADNVTTFTSSDFGRKLVENGDGSDHGWGGTQFVLGGAVSGRRVFGRTPEIGLGTIDDLGLGQLIPTTSTEQIGATLASWFGMPDTMLPQIFPNLGNFPRSAWNVGFLPSPA